VQRSITSSIAERSEGVAGANRSNRRGEPKNYLCILHMKKYSQLTLEQRYKIEALYNEGYSFSYIADRVGVHKSTINREMKRNVPKRGIGAKIYLAEKANNKSANRHSSKPKAVKFTYELKLKCKALLEIKWSPELIAAHWKQNNIQGVSHETIYKLIWECKHGNKKDNEPFKYLFKQLRNSKRRRKRDNYKETRSLIPNRTTIDKRPKVVDRRKRLGDFEVDLIMGKNHNSALLVTVERSSLKVTIDKLDGKKSAQITKTIIKRLKNHPSPKTLTFDNGLAFIGHEIIAKNLKVKTYFTRPYTSQDKGTIENRNGLIRVFFPKKTDFNLISKKAIKEVEKNINNRPVRKFKYLTPNQVYLKKLGSG
jgi:transposase, IS30 family